MITHEQKKELLEAIFEYGNNVNEYAMEVNNPFRSKSYVKELDMMITASREHIEKLIKEL